jgi:outer membrane protein TolC
MKRAAMAPRFSPLARRPALAVLLLATTLLAACAQLGADGGLGAVQQAVQARSGQQVALWRTPQDLQAAQRRVDELLLTPLSAEAAVQLALLNNRGLQARLQELGIAEADFVQAGRLPNPGFSWGRTSRGDEREIERGLQLNLLRLLTLPMARQLEGRRYAQSQSDAALRVLQLAHNTRKAWVQAVAAEEGVHYQRQVMQAAQASAELARRMAAVGNFNKLQQAREQAFYAEATLGLAQAQHQQTATRERLTRLLGLWGAQTHFKLPGRLPELPPEPAEQPDIESTALAQRLDVQGARLAAEQLAQNLGLTQATRFVNVLELGLVRNGSNQAPTQRGWEISLELPIFDSGSARLARAEATHLQAVHHAADIAVQARSEVREAYGAYRSAWDIARHHRDEIVPLHQRIAEENVLRYNGMLIGVFELLADARVQITSVNASIAALRDFWLAQAELEMAMVGGH